LIKSLKNSIKQDLIREGIERKGSRKKRVEEAGMTRVWKNRQGKGFLSFRR
jgi:hypothetical protein